MSGRQEAVSPVHALTLPRSAPELAANDSQHQGQHEEKDQGQSQSNNEWDEEVLARRPNYMYKRKKRYANSNTC